VSETLCTIGTDGWSGYHAAHDSNRRYDSWTTTHPDAESRLAAGTRSRAIGSTVV